jgi:hypothetical protein
METQKMKMEKDENEQTIHLNTSLGYSIMETQEMKTDEMVEKLKDYMESAGKNDAIFVFEAGIYTVNNEEELEKAIKQMMNEMVYDWSSMGFDFFSEKEMMKEEIGQELDDDKVHEITAQTFEKYYIEALLKEFKSLTMEKLSESD